MAPGLVKVALRRALRDVRHVRPVPRGRATGLVRAVYGQVERDFGMLAPPIGLHSPSPTALAASWVMLREFLVAEGVTSRADREIVASAVSQANACPYCVEVHGMALGSLGHVVEATAIQEGRSRNPLASWASGTATRPELDAVALAELTGVAFVFHYLNRMVSVFLGQSPLPPGVPASVRPMLGRFLKPIEGVAPGRSLDFLPVGEGDPPAWADGNSFVGDAFLRARSALSAPTDVCDVVRRELADWDGGPPGLGRSWLPERERPSVRFALLVAKAPYQVDGDVIEAVRREGVDDRVLIELAAWASFAAAEVCVLSGA